MRSTQSQLTAFNFRGNNVQKTVLKIALMLAAALVAPLSLAQDVAPDVLLRSITAEVIAIINQEGAIQSGNPAKVADLVETRILPHLYLNAYATVSEARDSIGRTLAFCNQRRPHSALDRQTPDKWVHFSLSWCVRPQAAHQ